MIWWGLIALYVQASQREDLLNLVEPKYTITTHFNSAFQPLASDFMLPIRFHGTDFKCYMPGSTSSNDTKVIKGALSTETAYYLTSSLEGQSLVMDRGEWWIYELRIGTFLRQFHYDRPGMVQKSDDPVPGQIMLGKWKETKRSYPQDLYALNSLPTVVTAAGHVLVFSKPQLTKLKYGVVLGWKVQVAGAVLELVYKVDDYFFLLKEAIPSPVFRAAYQVVQRREPLTQPLSHLFYKHYFACQECRFTGILASNDTLILVPFI